MAPHVFYIICETACLHIPISAFRRQDGLYDSNLKHMFSKQSYYFAGIRIQIYVVYIRAYRKTRHFTYLNVGKKRKLINAVKIISTEKQYYTQCKKVSRSDSKLKLFLPIFAKQSHIRLRSRGNIWIIYETMLETRIPYGTTY